MFEVGDLQPFATFDKAATFIQTPGSFVVRPAAIASITDSAAYSTMNIVQEVLIGYIVYVAISWRCL